MAGLIKAAMAVRDGTIPPSLNCRRRNPQIDWSSIEIPAQVEGWPGPDRAAGVSGFGIAGSNAHVILERLPEAAVREKTSPSVSRVPVLPISAESAGALRILADRYADLIEGRLDLSLSDIAAAAATRRTALPRRAAFAYPARGAMVAALRAFAAGGEATAAGNVPPGAARGIVFVAPGQGGQWTGMARDLLAGEPAFRADDRGVRVGADTARRLVACRAARPPLPAGRRGRAGLSDRTDRLAVGRVRVPARRHGRVRSAVEGPRAGLRRCRRPVERAATGRLSSSRFWASPRPNPSTATWRGCSTAWRGR